MSLGILAEPRARRRPALGAYTSKIPPECWAQKAFTDCHTKAYAKAQGECATAGLKDDQDCIGAATDSISMSTCPCTRASTTKPSTTKKPTVTTTTVTPVTDEGFEAEATILGLPMKSVAVVALVGVGLYLFTSKKKG